ncbi:MAG: hypothetical protein IJO22_06540 [Oscillospiraceae bacterium]|nr:hypothetical protein [Oscillospiraceae bacterium]
MSDIESIKYPRLQTETETKTRISHALRFLSAATHIPTMHKDIRATIPYSSDIFSVPPSLFIFPCLNHTTNFYVFPHCFSNNIVADYYSEKQVLENPLADIKKSAQQFALLSGFFHSNPSGIFSLGTLIKILKFTSVFPFFHK